MGKAVSGIVGSVANIFTGADSTKAAGEQAAAQQSQAARDAAAAAAFRPVGMTTRFGSSQFTREIDPRTGMPYVSAAGYTAAPELSGLQNRLFGQFGEGLTFAEQQQLASSPMGVGAQRLFELGGQILPSGYNTAPSAQAQALSAQYQQAMQGLLPTSYQSSVSPEAQAAAQQYQQYASMLAPTSVSTQASPEAQAYAQQLQGLSSQLIPSSFQTSASPEAQAYAQQLQQTGAGYLSQSPEEARAEYVRTQQAALAPGQEQQLAGIRNQLFQTGRGGLATGGTSSGGLQQTNPEMAAYYNSLAQQNLNIGAGAEQAAQQRQALGLGMLGQGYQTTAQAQEVARQNMLQNLGIGTQLSGQAFGTTQTAQEIARQNMLQNLGLSTQLTGQALGTQQTAQQISEQNLLNRLGLGLGFGQQAFATTATAEDIARQRSAADIGLGAGLFGTGGSLLQAQSGVASSAYSPLQTLLGLSGTTEQMAQMPLQLGIQLGQAQQPGQTQGAQMFQQGLSQAAQTQYGATQAANAANAQFWGGLISGASAAAGAKR
jgi:hypothetical protein